MRGVRGGQSLKHSSSFQIRPKGYPDFELFVNRVVVNESESREMECKVIVQRVLKCKHTLYFDMSHL